MPAKTQTTGKRGGKRSTSWKPGQSGNPSGRPPEGESWAGIIKTVSESDIDTILAVIGRTTELGKEINKLPRGVQLKYLVVVRVFASLIAEPTSGLWNGLMDRAEGKVKEQVDINGGALIDGERWERISAIIDKAYGRKEAAESNGPTKSNDAVKSSHAESLRVEKLEPTLDRVYGR